MRSLGPSPVSETTEEDAASSSSSSSAFRVAFLGLVGALALVACTEPEGEPGLPIGAAEHARELEFRELPTARTIPRKQFEAEEAARGAGLSEDYLSYMRESYGRLGFFPARFDLREVPGAHSSFFGAYYSRRTKQITLIGAPRPSIIIHELVHALQDQHFDFAHLYEQNVSSDEAIALRALVEGDAEMAEARFLARARGDAPAETLAADMTNDSAESASETVLHDLPGPAFFKAYPAFAYSYGARYVARRLEIGTGNWNLKNVDGMFRAGGPKTAQEVMRGGDPDAGALAPVPVPVGLAQAPSDLLPSYEIETVDRLGAWYSYLLFRPEGAVLPKVGAAAGADPLATIVAAWRGDQFVVFRERADDATRSNAEKPPRQRGVMWSSDWGSADKAEEVQARLLRLHRAVPEPELEMGDHVYRARDGELVWLSYSEGTLVFMKNLPPEVMQPLAQAVFDAREEPRMPINNPYARDRRALGGQLY